MMGTKTVSKFGLMCLDFLTSVKVLVNSLTGKQPLQSSEGDTRQRVSSFDADVGSADGFSYVFFYLIFSRNVFCVFSDF